MPVVRLAALLLAAASPTSAVAQASSEVEAPATYKVGAATVTAFTDGRGPFPANLFQGLSADETAALLRAGNEATTNADGSFAWAGSVHAFLVRTGGRTVLVDTGGGRLIPGAGKLAAGLAAAGVDPAAIDVVVISHMHGDHIGGLLDAAGKPAFTRATLRLDKAEAGYWGDPASAAAAPADQRAGFDLARKILDAYGARVVTFTGQTEIAPGLTAEPLHGHTPGHSLYRLRSGKAEMVFMGDTIHSIAVQMPRPDVTLGFDSDADAARAARIGFLKANAGKGILFAGPHFRTGVVTIDRAGRVFKATPVASQP